jgi:hypothetical protein
MGAENSSYARTPSENRLYGMGLSGKDDNLSAAQRRPADVGRKLSASLQSFARVAASFIEDKNTEVRVPGCKFCSAEAALLDLKRTNAFPR